MGRAARCPVHTAGSGRDDTASAADWNRSYRRMLAYLAAGGTLDGPANRTGGEADPAFRPGTWLRKQDKARSDGKLTGQQTALLDALSAA
ncbi:helicase associated domain-containing protein [Kitasatospora aureofaciens]